MNSIHEALLKEIGDDFDNDIRNASDETEIEILKKMKSRLHGKRRAHSKKCISSICVNVRKMF